MKQIVACLLLTAASLRALEDASTRKEEVRSLLERGSFASALTLSKAMQKERPDDIESYRLTAAAQMGLGEYAEAEKSIQWMLDLRIGKADAPGWLLVARFREATGDIEGALDAVNLAYGRLNPVGDEQKRLGGQLLAYAAQLHLLAGHLSLAEQAAAANEHPLARETMARIRLRQGRREEALGILRGLSAGHLSARYLLAETTGDFSGFDAGDSPEQVLYLAGPGKRPAEALELARRLLLQRKDVYALEALAMALAANGHEREAKETMQKALAVGTRDPRILEHAKQLGIAPATV